MSIANNREEGGRMVRMAWIYWADKQPDPKPSWLVPWEGLSEPDKEADRVIWDEITSPYVDVIASLMHEKDADLEQARKEIARLRIVVAQLTRYVQKHVLATHIDPELVAIMTEAKKGEKQG